MVKYTMLKMVDGKAGKSCKKGFTLGEACAKFSLKPEPVSASIFTLAKTNGGVTLSDAYLMMNGNKQGLPKKTSEK